MASSDTGIDHSTSIPFYRDERIINWIAQIVSAVLIIGFLIWVVVNFLAAAESRGFSLGFNFLNDPAGFPINDPGIEYDPSMTYGRAILVGIVNTLRVAIAGVLAATILGTIVALARLSPNWLLSRIALVYIEFHRNIPLLVLLFIWYFSVFTQFPPVRESLVLPGPVILNLRGLYISWPRLTETGGPLSIALIIGIVLAAIAYFVLRRRREETGQETYFGWVSLAIFIASGVIGWLASGGTPLYLDVPALDGFNYAGGLRLTPEFAALFVGLTMYTAGFIAEVVRAGIQAVDRGQVEAANAVGLGTLQVLSLVVIPQALRVIIPPMISQYLNLTKNSSLALAIGYQELFSVGRIAINQAGQAVPVFVIIMGSYLIMSLITSAVLNVYNRRIQFVTR